MKSPLILLAVLVATGFTSCSVYRSGQTPDDIYYSPGRTGGGGAGGDEYVDVRERQSSRYQSGSRYNDYDDYYSDDSYLRMRVRNQMMGGYNRWGMFDNYWDMGMYGPYGSGFGFSPGWSVGLGMGYGWGSPWSSPWNSWNMGWNHWYNWNSWYNPYYPGVIVVNPKENPGMYSKIRNFSLNNYSNTYNNRNATVNGRNPRSNYRLPSGATYNNSNRSSSFGGAVRKAFQGSQNNNRNYNNDRGSYGRPDRTYTPPSSNNSTYGRGGNYGGGSSGGSGGSSGGSSGGGGGVSRPGRN